MNHHRLIDRTRRTARALSTAAALAAAVSLAPAPAAAQLPAAVADEPLPTLAPIIERAAPAVVNIAVRGTVEMRNPFMDDPTFRRFFGVPPTQEREFRSAGSGVIVDAEEGYILTNAHVVENADEITITLQDNRTFDAEVVGSDAQSDIAVLKVEQNDLVSLPLADSDEIRVGDFVVAIGNPFGLRHTVTSGIISALGRQGLNPEGYEDFIQTDAAINPGNSGGALINLKGELVGINAAIFSTNRTPGNIGIGFAIPTNMARSVMDQILRFGEVRRGLLGVSILTVTPSIAEAYDLPRAEGALVQQVSPGSAAAQAGIQVDDIIVSVDGENVANAAELRNEIGMKRPGEEVEIGLLRDGKERTIEATLGEAGPLVTGDAGEIDDAFAGARLTDAEDGEGVLVAEVAPDSPAFQRGLRPNDVIVSVNRNRVRNLEEFREAVSGSGAVILRILRDNQNLLVPIR